MIDRPPLYEAAVVMDGRTVQIASGFADLETDAWRQAGLRFWARLASVIQKKEMSVEILSCAQWGSDYTIAYIDGRPAAISEKRSGGHYAFVKDGEYIYNQYKRQCWYVNDGKWHSTLSARSFAQQDILVDVAVSGTRREVNDGSEKVYEGGLEKAFTEAGPAEAQP